VWLVIALLRAAIGVPGHIGVGAVLGAGIVVFGLSAVTAVMFGYLSVLLITIWRERWDWLVHVFGPNPPARAATGTGWHSELTGVPQVIMALILEIGLYWLTFLSGCGILLGMYVLASLAWNGNVALTTAQIL